MLIFDWRLMIVLKMDLPRLAIGDRALIISVSFKP